jgi:hypothetical protein
MEAMSARPRRTKEKLDHRECLSFCRYLPEYMDALVGWFLTRCMHGRLAGISLSDSAFEYSEIKALKSMFDEEAVGKA